MNRNEIQASYKINKDGVITSLGKFEREMIYVPYYWDCALSGMFAEDVNGVFFVPLDKDDYLMFPELDNAYGIAVEESEQGFVSATLFQSQAEYNASVERMEREELENASSEDN